MADQKPEITRKQQIIYVLDKLPPYMVAHLVTVAGKALVEVRNGVQEEIDGCLGVLKS